MARVVLVVTTMDDLKKLCSHDDFTATSAQLFVENVSKVYQIASAFHRRLPACVPFDDLISCGIVGLIEAIRRFDPNKNCPFQHYAAFRIRGAIVDGLRDMDWASRGLRLWERKIRDAREKLTQTLMREPDERELAAELSLRLDDFRRILRDLNNLRQAWIYRSDKLEPEAPTDFDALPDLTQIDPDVVICRSELMHVLNDEMKHLPLTEQRVLKLYYLEELTMKRVGAMLGVGESRVSQIHAQAIHRLRNLLSTKYKRLLADAEFVSPGQEMAAVASED
jgi:RNA polymerase sigma factor for flagellar operon FliA